MSSIFTTFLGSLLCSRYTAAFIHLLPNNKSGARACTGTACTQGAWSACTACSSNGEPVAFNAPSSSKNPQLQGSSAVAAAGSANFCPGGKPHAVTNDHAVCAA